MIGALSGSQNGREVEIVNSFDLILVSGKEEDKVDLEVVDSRKDQCTHMYCIHRHILIPAADKQVFPSLYSIGWYTVANQPTARNLSLSDQFHIHPHRCFYAHALMIAYSLRSVAQLRPS